MAGLFKKSLKMLTGSDTTGVSSLFKSKPSRRQVIQKESEIGGQLFGPVPEGHHRQFFNLDRRTWIWYEEWPDGKGGVTRTTTRYEVHENGILKVQEGAPYHFIDGQELMNLVTAMRVYYERVMREVYRRDPTTGQRLAA